VKHGSSRRPLHAKCSLVAEVRTELSFDSGGDALRKVVAMIGCRSRGMPAASGRRSARLRRICQGGATEPSFVLREAVLRREIVLRDVRLRPLSLACSSGAKVRTKPSFDSGGDALLKVGASGRSIQVTVSSFRAPRCSAVER
jgi:hypothetical protein